MQIEPAQIEEIFAEAAAMADAAARAAYLEQACGDDAALRERVEALLAAHDSGDSFMQLPDESEQTTVTFFCLSEGPGTKIGRYKLLEEIGEGGFGVVFMAEQEEPVRRRVALKIIKAGMDTRQVVARFEAERQALAMMDHPNIARVFDAGATDTGRPYFVMELVKGIPITEYCDQHALSIDERLNLFMAVCSAVQHAHQKGIIHRDLKPSNVMVTLHDDKPVPKIIDFGIAKATQARLTDKTLFTEFRQLIGTPAYMSPEQAQMIGLDVDTRSDIYSLGVLLYELLAGSTPFDSKQLMQSGYDEMRRIIREVEPPRPSTRYSHIARPSSGSLPSAGRAGEGGRSDAATIATNRGVDPQHLSHELRGDLDWIVMKCLEKDRNRRYETPNSLARDIERYLADEPVQACPPSAAYRLRKFIRRNKIAAAFVLLLVAAVAALAVSNIQTRRNERRALTETAKATAVSELLQELLASSNPDQTKGSQYTVRELLDDFSVGLGDRLAGEREVEGAIRSVVGKSYWRLGVYGPAEQHLKKALDLRRQLYGENDARVADTLVDYAWNLAEQSRLEEAEKHVCDALSIYRRQNSDPRATVRALWSLQQYLAWQSRFAEAEQIANEALALAGDEKNSDYMELANVLHCLAEAKSMEGKHEEAERLARRAIDIHRRLHGNHHPETAWALVFLGRALIGQQKLAEGEPPLREALKILRGLYSPEHMSVQTVSRNLASVLEAKGDRAALEALVTEQAEQEGRSDSPGYHVRLATLLLTNNSLSDAQLQEAHRSLRRAIEGYNQAAINAGNNLDRRQTAWGGYMEVVRVCAAAPGFTSEVDEIKRILNAEFTEWLSASPDPSALANALQYTALAQLRLGDESGYRATCKALIDMPVGNLDDTAKSRAIWTSCLGPNALEDLNLPVMRAEEFIKNNSLNQPHFGLYVLGAALYRAGQYELAAKRLDESIAMYQSNQPSGISDAIKYPRLFLAMTKWQLGRRDEARRLLAEIQPAIDKELPSPSTFWSRRATLEILRAEAEALIERDDADEIPNPDTSPPAAPPVSEP